MNRAAVVKNMNDCCTKNVTVSAVTSSYYFKMQTICKTKQKKPPKNKSISSSFLSQSLLFQNKGNTRKSEHPVLVVFEILLKNQTTIDSLQNATQI